jgi:hypothetical protein
LTTFPSETFSYNTDAKPIVQATQAIIQMWQTVMPSTVQSEGFAFDKLLALASATVNNPHGLQIWTSGCWRTILMRKTGCPPSFSRGRTTTR